MWIGWKKGKQFVNVESGARLEIGSRGVLLMIPGHTPVIVVRFNKERKPDKEFDRIMAQLAVKHLVLWVYD